MTNNEPKRPPRYWETADFWKDALERIISTFFFTFIGLITVDGFQFTWRSLGVAAIAAALSTIKAIIGAQRKESTTPVSII